MTKDIDVTENYKDVKNCENQVFDQEPQDGPTMVRQQHMLLSWVTLCCWVPQKLFQKYTSHLRFQF